MDKKDKINSIFSILEAEQSLRKGAINILSPLYLLMDDDQLNNSTLYLDDIKATEIPEKLNSGVFCRADEREEPTIHIVKEVSYKEINKCCKFNPNILVHNIRAYDPKLKNSLTQSFFYGSSNRQKWDVLDKERSFNNPVLNHVISVCCQYQLFFYDIDYLEISKPGTNPIRIPTYPESTKELLKMRDIPEHKRRREHLINWVSDHFRETKKTTTHIKRHKRGVETCTWEGFKISIYKNI